MDYYWNERKSLLHLQAAILQEAGKLLKIAKGLR